MATTVPCPTCKTPVTWSASSAFRPFCCERCKLIDLGEWAAGERKLPGAPLTDADLIDVDDPEVLAALMNAQTPPLH